MQNSFDAVVFDLDGVITQTAAVHSNAWKSMFDEFLTEWCTQHSLEYKEFSQDDYLAYVDGKPRYEGVQSFLASRSIQLPFGTPEDVATTISICGLGNRKNELFNEILARDGVEVFQSSIELIHELKRQGIRIGVASSSKNCQPILQRSGLESLFEVRIDGVVSAERNIKGKPAPDIFMTACDDMGVSYDRTVVVEDAVSGVMAGQRGRFGLVLGLAREENHEALRTNGADIVLNDLSEITISQINDWFDSGLPESLWTIAYDEYIPGKEATRETLLTVGNGYFATRGAFEECQDNGVNYPGTYMAGLFNRLDSKVAERIITNEDFVNCPNWLPIQVGLEGEWCDPNSSSVQELTRSLDFRTGTLKKCMSYVGPNGVGLNIRSTRFVSMANRHLACLVYEVTPEREVTLDIRSALDASVTNNGVERYRQLESLHWQGQTAGAEEALLWITATTTQSQTEIAEVASHRILVDQGLHTADWEYQFKDNLASLTTKISLKAGQTVRIEKIVAVCTSREDNTPLAMAKSLLQPNLVADTISLANNQAWKKLWKKVDIKIDGDRLAQKILRLHAYHLLVTASENALELDVAIPARGLHGEAYRGHIFWDEVFILPWFNLHLPEVSKESLIYRFNRLPAARAYAKEHGYKGAMFPWQSGSDGSEETQVVHLNPLSGKWGPDYSSFQRHVSLAIAFNTWQYCHMAGDSEFWLNQGAELFLDICSFWSSKAQFSEDTGRYHIKNVMGPNEFHEHAKNCDGGGLVDNAYTNILTSWTLDKGVELFASLPPERAALLKQQLGITENEVSRWSDISKKLNIVIKGEVIAHFDGFFELGNLDFEDYKTRYGNIYRMDRLLKKEGKSPDDYQVSKQADTLMAFFLLGSRGVYETLQRLGYAEQVSENFLRKNYDYYLPITTHGSTLSRIAHANIAQLMGDGALSFELYTDALFSDFNDVQGGTTGEGIHVGVMASSICVALSGYLGFDFNSKVVTLDPRLPELWKTAQGQFTFQKFTVAFEIAKTKVTLTLKEGPRSSMLVNVRGQTVTINKDQAMEVLFKEENDTACAA